MQRKVLCGLMVLLLLTLALPAAHAAVVGRFTLVTGQVDLLKQGKLPAIPAKVQDGVEIGDVVRTKSKAKAQLTMVDDSSITLAPESRLAIADYQYNSVREERRAVVRLFQGLVHTVVKRIIKTEEPDFIMETHTATVGVRGTNWFSLVAPNSTLTALQYGNLSVTPKFPGAQGILLHSMQFIQAPKPFLIQALTPEMLKMLQGMMDKGVRGSGLGTGLFPPVAGDEGFQTPMTPPGSPEQKLLQQTIPPVVVPQPQTLPPPVHTGS